jgi:putative endonuclease
MQGGWVYILTNRPNGTLYVGVTADLARRIYEHREGLVDGFSRRYGLKQLVYAEHHDRIELAIQREITIKHWPRAWKANLILSRIIRHGEIYTIRWSDSWMAATSAAMTEIEKGPDQPGLLTPDPVRFTPTPLPPRALPSP